MKHRSSNAWPILTANAESSNTKTTEPDPYLLHGSDHTSMMLVSHQLDGNNFLSWKRSMMIALGAKTKLGFINGEIEQPNSKDEKYAAWRKINWTVLSWTLNSLLKDIAESFLYAEKSKELWEDICQRYGGNNGPMRYKVQREISSLNQGNNTVMEYFNKLKKLWDEFACIVPLKICDCEKGKMMLQYEAENRLMQFLMGLNDGYDHLKNQVLLMEPLPSVSKAYSMALTAERQRSVQNLYGEKVESVAVMVKSGGYGRGAGMQGRGNYGGQWNLGRGRGGMRMTKEERAKLMCEKCGMHGHTIATCFKIHGIPDWFKKLKEQQGRSYANNIMAYVCGEVQTQKPVYKDEAKGRDLESVIKQLNELTQYIKGKEESNNKLDYARFVSFLGVDEGENVHYALSMVEGGNERRWIIDTGASRHICTNDKIMRNMEKIEGPVSICLPDGY